MGEAHPRSGEENRLPFRDRAEAGRLLAERLHFSGADTVALRGRQPRALVAVGAWYASFPQITDGEVRELLERGSSSGGR